MKVELMESGAVLRLLAQDVGELIALARLATGPLRDQGHLKEPVELARQHFSGLPESGGILRLGEKLDHVLVGIDWFLRDRPWAHEPEFLQDRYAARLERARLLVSLDDLLREQLSVSHLAARAGDPHLYQALTAQATALQAAASPPIEDIEEKFAAWQAGPARR